MISPEEATRIFTECKRAYQLVFSTEAGRAVLLDLTKYCRGRQTCVATEGNNPQIDVYRTFILEGRRDVLLNILDYIELPVEQLVERYTMKIPLRPENSE